MVRLGNPPSFLRLSGLLCGCKEFRRQCAGMGPRRRKAKEERDEAVEQTNRIMDQALQPGWPAIHARPSAATKNADKEGPEIPKANIFKTEAPQKLRQVLGAEDAMNSPQGGCKTTHDPPLITLQVGNHQNKPPARLDEREVLGDYRSQVIEMLDQAGGVN